MDIWLWVKNGYPKFNLGKWTYELKSAVPWFSFDPQPCVSRKWVFRRSERVPEDPEDYKRTGHPEQPMST